jgi:hypothetical protein
MRKEPVNARQLATVAAFLFLVGVIAACSACVRDNGEGAFDPITEAQYREALTNEQALAR